MPNRSRKALLHPLDALVCETATTHLRAIFLECWDEIQMARNRRNGTKRFLLLLEMDFWRFRHTFHSDERRSLCVFFGYICEISKRCQRKYWQTHTQRGASRPEDMYFMYVFIIVCVCYFVCSLNSVNMHRRKHAVKSLYIEYNFHELLSISSSLWLCAAFTSNELITTRKIVFLYFILLHRLLAFSLFHTDSKMCFL